MSETPKQKAMTIYRTIGRYALAVLAMVVMVPCVWLYACGKDERVRGVSGIALVLLGLLLAWQGSSALRAAKGQREQLAVVELQGAMGVKALEVCAAIQGQLGAVERFAARLDAIERRVAALPHKTPWWKFWR